MAGERSADEIQRDIEQSRAALATAVDQLAYRGNPKRVAENVKQTLREKAQSPQGRVVIGVTGVPGRRAGHPADPQALRPVLPADHAVTGRWTANKCAG